MSIHLSGKFYGMRRPIDQIRLRRRFAGINAAAKLHAAGSTPAEIEQALGATPNHVRHLLASIEKIEQPQEAKK